MTRKYIRKTSEKDGKEILIWNRISSKSEEAKVNGYTLTVDWISKNKFSWEVWYNSEIVAMGNINGDCNTAGRAKDKATYRMRKHKSLTIKPVINERS